MTTTADRSTYVPFARPSITDAEIEDVLAVLRTGWLTTGPVATEFERRFASYVEAPHAVALNSCTAALHLSLLAADVGPGDEVVTTPLTFCATANVVVHVGAAPVFADIDPVTQNLDPAAAAAAVTWRTRALLPVHFAGRPVDALAMRSLADRHGLALVEDAAHAVEGVSNGGRVGAVADYTCFSFYATKNLTTGEGGMLTARSAERIDFVRMAALHGMSRDAWCRYRQNGSALYDVVMAGFKYNMMDVQAAIGLRQLARIDAMLARRNALWARYDEGLADLPLVLPAPVRPGDVHARHLYTVLVDPERCGWTRNALVDALAAEGIRTSVHFTALHLLSFYQERFGLRRGMFPKAEYVSDSTMSLPFSAAMSDEEADRVVATLARVLRSAAR